MLKSNPPITATTESISTMGLNSTATTNTNRTSRKLWPFSSPTPASPSTIPSTTISPPDDGNPIQTSEYRPRPILRSLRPASLFIPNAVGVASVNSSSTTTSDSDSVKRRSSWYLFSLPSSASSSSNNEKSPVSSISSSAILSPASIVNNNSKEQVNVVEPSWPHRRGSSASTISNCNTSSNNTTSTKSGSHPLSNAVIEAFSPVTPNSEFPTPIEPTKPIILKSKDDVEFTLPISAVLDSIALRPLFYEGLSTGSTDLDAKVLKTVVDYLMHHSDSMHVQADAWDVEWVRTMSDDEVRLLIDAFSSIGNSSGQTLLQREIIRRTARRPVVLHRGLDDWKKKWSQFEETERRAAEDAKRGRVNKEL